MSNFAQSIRSKPGVALPATALSEAFIVGSRKVYSLI